MVWAALHRVVIALTLLAFVGGMTLQVMPPKIAIAGTMSSTADDCAQMAMPPDHGSSSHKVPCKDRDNLPECIKQMGCLGTPSLPERLGSNFVPFAYGKVVYPTLATPRDGRSIKPDLFPPIGL